MNKYKFSATTTGFYPVSLLESYEEAGSLPDDLVDVTDDDYATFVGQAPAGKMRGSNKKGYPAWVDIPAPTEDELIDLAEDKKQALIEGANDYINSKQWPGKAAIGRLKGEDLTQYNLWLDYLDLLYAVDASMPQNIKWPKPPN